MTREEAVLWLKAISTKKFGWDDYAMQDSEKEIRERCEQSVREAIDMAIEALSAEPNRKWETCFSCPLAKGCPQIQGKSNDEIAEYASEIPNGCPLSMSHDSDLISRADAIEAIYACHPKGRQSVDNTKFHYGNYTHGLYDAVCAVKDCEEVALPLVEAKGDLISRADAIRRVKAKIKWFNGDAIEDKCKRDAFIQVLDDILIELPPIDVVSREEYDRLYDDAISELTKLEKEYDDVIAQLNQKLENSVSREAYEKALIECGEVKTKLGELQQTTKANQGEWIKTVDGNGWNDWYVLKCPFCGATIEDKHYHSWEYNFCPHCGEKVRGWT